MEAKYTIQKGDRELGRMVAVGPLKPEGYPQLEVPIDSLWRVSYDSLGLALDLDLAFSGERLEIRRMTVSGLFGKPVQSRDLTQLGLPSVIREISALCVPNYEFWTKDFQDRNMDWASLKHDDVFLAQLMWVEQIGHGNPRKALMEYFGIPRSTSTVIIKRLRAKYPMPTI